MKRLAIVLLAFVPAARAQDDSKAQVDVVLREGTWSVPADLMLRARVTAMTPSEPTKIEWRHGGEGLGGTPTKGSLAESLPIGTWSPAVPVASFNKGKFPAKLFVTFMVGRGGKLVRGEGSDGFHRTEGYSTDVEVEFEFAWKGKVLKSFKESGPDGGTVGIVIPAYCLAGGRTPDDARFVKELSGLLDYARQRAARVEALLGSSAPRLKRFGVTTNLGGYGSGSYYGTRFTNKAVLEAEIQTLRLLGVNGFVGGPRFLSESKDFNRMLYAQLGGYPVPAAQKGRELPEAGCPFAPGVAARTKEMIEKGLAAALTMPVEEVWWRTEDEIGSIFDRAPEGKAHPATCANCAEGFRTYLKDRGIKPGDLGKADWTEIRPADLTAKPAATGLVAYHTAMFQNHASARLFTPVRDALARANAEKRKDPSLKQPFVYSFALRGNTFLMGGHSLDFFDYYRAADNAFVYETSNRDARIWGWDSYLCDVGRTVGARQDLKLGIYVKPHRGAPIQRALSAAGRGFGMIYWYTYGPEYAKGDTFASSDEVLVKTARAASLLARSEEVLYGATWAVPAEVAVVNPRSSEIWARLAGGSPAAYENAKWIYTALAHAHLPVDPLDEGMLATADLSRYKVIYISGAHLTAAAASKVADWVKAGGTLCTSAGGLARDEADQPLAAMAPVLGLEVRAPVDLWAKVQAYGATRLEAYPAAAGAEIEGLKLVVGREILKPAAGTEVVARFADGGAAVTRRAFGKGEAWVAGFFPGLEYSAAVRAEEFDMSRDFDTVRRLQVAGPALARTKPVVDSSQPLVEGVLLRNGGRRAVTLMNWAYRVPGKGKSPVLLPFKDLKVTIRGAGELTRVTSTALQQPLAIERSGDAVTITLPLLEEGDVLLLD